MEPDPLREIREIRRQISLECDNDPEKVFDYYVAHQERMKATGNFRFVTRPTACVSNSVTVAPCDEGEPQ